MFSYTQLAALAIIRTPALFHAELNRKGQSFARILEDLGFVTVGGQVLGVTPEQRVAAVQAGFDGCLGPALEKFDWLFSDYTKQVIRTLGPKVGLPLAEANAQNRASPRTRGAVATNL